MGAVGAAEHMTGAIERDKGQLLFIPSGLSPHVGT